jgi:hypothetical protein
VVVVVVVVKVVMGVTVVKVVVGVMAVMVVMLVIVIVVSVVVFVVLFVLVAMVVMVLVAFGIVAPALANVVSVVEGVDFGVGVEIVSGFCGEIERRKKRQEWMRREEVELGLEGEDSGMVGMRKKIGERECERLWRKVWTKLWRGWRRLVPSVRAQVCSVPSVPAPVYLPK